MTIDLARAALAAHGGGDEVAPLAAGMSSQAWVATIGGDEFVVRTPTPYDARADPDYRAEQRLNHALRSAGVPATRLDVVEVNGIACSIAPRIVGTPIQPDQWTNEFVGDVAAALAATHSVPVGGHDLPGAAHRFHLARVWPLDDTSLGDHPVAVVLPGTLDWVRSQTESIVSEASRLSCIVHTDLHWDHLLRSPAGRLAGLLDFGDAFAGPPAWDFACLRYYHGEEVGRRVAAHYPNGSTVLRRSMTLGIAFALYKLDKTPDRADVIERVARLIRAG